MSAPELVIFDCDGVLVDSEVISNRILAESLTTLGLPTTLPESRRAYQGLLLSEVATRAEAALGRPLPAGWLERYERDREAAFRRELRPVAGAAEAVDGLIAAGVGVCVASQGAIAKTRLSLELTGLRDRFGPDALFSAHDVARGKPAPDLFLHAARTMGASPARCVVVEDSASGVRAAAAAQMRVLGYVADSEEAALLAAGAEVFAAMTALPGLLGLPGSDERRQRLSSG